MNDAQRSGVILVVEDEEDTRELLRELLEDRGYAVTTAEDGQNAIAVLRSTPNVCLVILDLVMPGMDGHAVLGVMAVDPKLSKLPVCISTSAVESAPAGLPCLSKPVDMGRLYAVVDQYCAS